MARPKKEKETMKPLMTRDDVDFIGEQVRRSRFYNFCLAARLRLSAVYKIDGQVLTTDDLRAVFDEGQLTATETADHFAEYVKSIQ